ncbi:MAG TPA: HAMP domain-containing sensor histidine kinase [Kofleriaceae bacterium]|jgi:signal transduction histidine kinase|nr:HAMP domain-containing sensor histidine kinase [Kofleriaceae bacterium]
MVALVAVVGLAVANIGLDLMIGHQTAVRTGQLVDDSLRSVALADDLRYQAHRLSAAPLDRAQLISIAGQIGADAREYDPIATGLGERTEWSTLQLLFGRLQKEHEDPGSIAPLVAAIEESIARLIAINQRAARDHEAAIAELHHHGLIIDAAIGAIMLVLAIGVGLALLHSLHRQRQLGRMHIAAMDERNRELEAFAGRVAHDLRGPLTPVAMNTSLLLKPGTDVPAVAARIHRSVERMAELIDDLLALSVAGRVRAGRGDVATVVHEVLDDLRFELHDADITLTIANCATACSPGVLAQLMRNLVTNAIKYRGADRRLLLKIDAMPRGGDATARPANDATLVEIVVTDNGVGMTREAVAHAFDPFYRANPTPGIPGHGLGLAIVKRTLDAMGGDCHLASAPNEGTSVTLRLPAA